MKVGREVGLDKPVVTRRTDESKKGHLHLKEGVRHVRRPTEGSR